MNNTTPLVSILTPCYNSEAYIQRMLDSILNQTYPNIELICIDDGSNDKTAQIIQAYIPVFESKNLSLIYMSRKHSGQAAAVNAGLKIMKGDYFCLLDSDDYLIESSVEKRVEALDAHREYSVVVSDYYIVNEDDLGTIIGRGNDYIGDLAYQPYQFYLTLTGYSSITPVGYMIRTADMRKINPQMEINECQEGQNYQILLPLYYHYKRMYLHDPLAFYVVRNSSHAHQKRTRIQEKERNRNLLRMLDDILGRLELPNWELQKYKNMSIFSKLLEDV